MSAPIFDRSSGDQPSPSGGRGRRRLRLLVAACLVAAAVAVGTTVALAGRGPSPAVAAAQQPAAGPSGQQSATKGQVTAKSRGEGKDDVQPRTKAKGEGEDGATSGGTAEGVPVLPDGVHHTLIRKVDIDRGRLTVDVVQLFLDGDAVKAAIADGKPRAQAEVLTVYLRNQNPRLRTLPLAGDAKLHLYQPCEEETDRRALLEQLAGNVRLGIYFHSLTVRDGVVHALQERQLHPAC